MKNKLSPEEQLLHSKLNEPQFTYQDADWKQIESVVAKKGFWSNYSPFFKAAAAFVVLATAMYIVNTKYDKPAESRIETVVTLTKKANTAAIADEEAIILTDGITTSENIPVKEIITSQVLEVQRGNPTTDVENIEDHPKPVQNLSTTPIEALKQAEPEPIIETQLDSSLEITNINILSKTCINSLIEFKGEYTTSYEEDLYYSWLVDGKPIQGESAKNSYTFDSEGIYTLTFIVSYEGNLLGKYSQSIEISPSEAVDFTYSNLDNPFYDNNINLKVVNPQDGKYMWYFNKYNDRVQFGKETAWFFKNQGTYQMNLDYTNKEGCVSTETKSVEMKKHFTAQIFPNTFTPADNDGVNDEFVLAAFHPFTYTKYLLEIRDVSGNIVFKTNDKFHNWNGRLNNSSGSILKGNFVWIVEIENKYARKKVFQGKLSIKNY